MLRWGTWRRSDASGRLRQDRKGRPMQPYKLLPGWSITGALTSLMAGLSIATFLLLITGGPNFTSAQEKKPAGTAGNSSNAASISRGKYIVTEVAKCGNCHTPRTQNGEIDYNRWLAGGPVPYLPAQPERDWPLLCPRIGGLPPASDAEMITLLTTGIWTTGKPLRSPMPEFHMTRADAEAVLAYLKSITSGRGGTE
jgi:mono/diheme cytochrome c family protein